MSNYRESLAVAVASGAKIKNVAEDLGISAAAAYRIHREKETQERIAELRDDAAREAIGKLSALATEAVDVIATLMRDNSIDARVQLQAAKAVLERLLPMAEQFELRERLKALEHAAQQSEETGANASDGASDGA